MMSSLVLLYQFLLLFVGLSQWSGFSHRVLDEVSYLSLRNQIHCSRKQATAWKSTLWRWFNLWHYAILLWIPYFICSLQLKLLLLKTAILIGASSCFTRGVNWLLQGLSLHFSLRMSFLFHKSWLRFQVTVESSTPFFRFLHPIVKQGQTRHGTSMLAQTLCPKAPVPLKKGGLFFCKQ